MQALWMVVGAFLFATMGVCVSNTQPLISIQQKLFSTAVSSACWCCGCSAPRKASPSKTAYPWMHTLAQPGRRYRHGHLVLCHHPAAAGQGHDAELHEQPVDCSFLAGGRTVVTAPAQRQASASPQHPLGDRHRGGVCRRGADAATQLCPGTNHGRTDWSGIRAAVRTGLYAGGGLVTHGRARIAHRVLLRLGCTVAGWWPACSRAFHSGRAGKRRAG